MSESDIIKLTNQSIYTKGIVVDYFVLEWSVIILYVCIFYQVVTSSYRGNSTQRITSTRSILSVDIDQTRLNERWTIYISWITDVFMCFCIRVVFGWFITHELICGINFMLWVCRYRSYRALYMNHDTSIILWNAVICLDIYFENIHMIKIWHFNARDSANTNIINGLNIIYGCQSCVWYILHDVWKEIYLWEYELVS